MKSLLIVCLVVWLVATPVVVSMWGDEYAPIPFFLLFFIAVLCAIERASRRIDHVH